MELRERSWVQGQFPLHLRTVLSNGASAGMQFVERAIAVRPDNVCKGWSQWSQVTGSHLAES